MLPFEVASICLEKIRRHSDQRDALMVAFGMLDRMEIGLVEVDRGETLALAERAGLSAYDASYLWLARRMRSELVTLDRQLETAGATGLRGRAVSPRRP
jgi:predicted nucleic acid-binding protein